MKWTGWEHFRFLKKRKTDRRKWEWEWGRKKKWKLGEKIGRNDEWIPFCYKCFFPLIMHEIIIRLTYNYFHFQKLFPFIPFDPIFHHIRIQITVPTTFNAGSSNQVDCIKCSCVRRPSIIHNLNGWECRWCIRRVSYDFTFDPESVSPSHHTIWIPFDAE